MDKHSNNSLEVTYNNINNYEDNHLFQSDHSTISESSSYNSDFVIIGGYNKLITVILVAMKKMMKKQHIISITILFIFLCNFL